SNGNGFKDLNEDGIANVDVKLSWFEGGIKQSATVTTNSAGAYTGNVTLGQVSIAVDGDTVKSPFQPFIILGSGEYEVTTDNDTQTVTFEGVVGISPFGDVGYKNSFSFSFPEESKDTGRGGTDDT